MAFLCKHVHVATAVLLYAATGADSSPVIPGTGYGCNMPCNSADVNYVLRAQADTYKIEGSRNLGNGDHSTFVLPGASASAQELIWGKGTKLSERGDFSFFTRTFVDGGSASEHCWGMDGNTGPLGPCLQVSPGQSVMIKVINDVGNGMQKFGQHIPTTAEWYGQEQQFSSVTPTGNYTIENGNHPFGPLPTSADEKQPLANTIQNLPGYDTGKDMNGTTYGFDSTNIHLHGLEVEPHLFHPQGTSDPDAEWISIEPNNNAGRQCYCYHFHVSPSQSIGTFLWHVHRHGTSAMQSWNGMFGYMLVVPPANSRPIGHDAATNAQTTHNLDFELAKFGVADAPFIMWDLVLRVQSGGHGKDPKNVVMTTDQWLNAQSNGNINKTTVLPFLVNNNFQPFLGRVRAEPQTWRLEGGASIEVRKYLRPNEPLRLRLACVSTDNLCGFKIRRNFANGTANPKGEAETFYHVASDGFGFDHAVSRKFLILSGGQREDVVIQLQGGQYSVWSQGLGNIKFFGLGPGDQLLSQILVAGSSFPGGLQLREYLDHLTPGAPKANDIRSEEIQGARQITFGTKLQLNRIPFQQYDVSDKAYDLSGKSYVVSGSHRVEEWIIDNPTNTLHPFHMHVNPFQIIEVRSNACALTEDTSECMAAMQSESYKAFTAQQLNPGPRWRDTVMIPVYGSVRIRTRFTAGVNGSAFFGKTVFHCHMTSHEDTGMMANIFLSGNASVNNSSMNRIENATLV